MLVQLPRLLPSGSKKELSVEYALDSALKRLKQGMFCAPVTEELFFMGREDVLETLQTAYSENFQFFTVDKKRKTIL